MERVTDLQDLAEALDITLEPDEDFRLLTRAIDKGRIFLTDDTKLCVRMKNPVKVNFGDGESEELVFKRATGAHRLAMQNSPERKRGDAMQRCINKMCDIQLAQLKTLESSEVAILEQVFHFLL